MSGKRSARRLAFKRQLVVLGKVVYRDQLTLSLPPNMSLDHPMVAKSLLDYNQELVERAVQVKFQQIN